MKDNFIFRLHVIYVLIIFFSLVIAGRLFFIQVVRGQDYRDIASNQYIAPSFNHFDRGNIFFQKKDGQLSSAAAVKKGYILAINSQILEDPETAYSQISKIVDIDEEDFLARASKDDPYEEIIHKLSKDDAGEIRDLNIRGVGVFSETWRFYPAGELASRLLGFVGYKDNKLSGRYGLERYYESNLKQEDGDGLTINAFAEIFLDIKKTITGTMGESDLVLTVDPVVQSFVENILGKLADDYSAELAIGVVVEPKTGRILAMSSKPNFDPNNYGDVDDMSLFFNPVVESVFEVGSIVKPLTLSAALDQGAITSDTTYYDKGYVVIEDSTIKNHDSKERGYVTMQDVLNNSLNNGAVLAMQKLGRKRFKEYMIDFGLGERTEIDLPNEVKGMISNLDSKREIEYATASFGQGIAMSPISVAMAMGTLANNGMLMKPYVVSEIRSKDGLVRVTKPEIIRQVLKPETTEEISRMLTIAVDEALLGGKISLDHYTVAAKTGTAQIYKKDEKGYSEREFLHSFVGYAPAFDAKFLTLIILVKPDTLRDASLTLARPFMDITKFLLNYYEVPPDR